MEEFIVLSDKALKIKLENKNMTISVVDPLEVYNALDTDGLIERYWSEDNYGNDIEVYKNNATNIPVKMSEDDRYAFEFNFGKIHYAMIYDFIDTPIDMIGHSISFRYVKVFKIKEVK
jgi:hypothetical protein